MHKIIIEACCGSADDVYEATAAGVHRIELNSALFLGGLTPSIGMMRVALEARIPIMAMVRPRQGGFCYTQREYQTMLADCEALLDAGANGIVFGILGPDGTVDSRRCAPLVEMVKKAGRQAVFHRAIDVTPDWRQAIDALIDLGVDRVLTSGQHPSVYDGAAIVRAMREYASGRIEILPGAGINLSNVKRVLSDTGCDQIHVMLDKPMTDTSISNRHNIYFGGALYPSESIFSMSDSKQFAQLIEAVNQ